MQLKVAPLVGAWIEIRVQECKKLAAVVAPLVGAWIEIIKVSIEDTIIRVAPLVGAWIEINWFRSVGSGGLGRSPRGSVD